MKKKIRIIIDISMTVMMPLLMAYSLIGELFHEITGSLIFILLAILEKCRNRPKTKITHWRGYQIYGISILEN